MCHHRYKLFNDYKFIVEWHISFSSKKITEYQFVQQIELRCTEYINFHCLPYHLRCPTLISDIFSDFCSISKFDHTSTLDTASGSGQITDLVSSIDERKHKSSRPVTYIAKQNWQEHGVWKILMETNHFISWVQRFHTIAV